MPVIKSAKKRVRVAKRARTENIKTKRSLREAIKAFRTKVANKKDTTQAQSDAYSAIDTAVKKGVLSKNKAARKKAQLNTAAKLAGTTKPGMKTAKKPASTKREAPASSKKPASSSKPAAKKTTAKTSPARVAKKPAAKKTSKK